MFTISRNGVLSLCVMALLAQNVQMQAWSFTDLYNTAKNNPKTTAAVIVGVVAAGIAAYKWFFKSNTFALVPYANYTVRSFADLHKEHTFAIGDTDDGQHWVLVGTKAHSLGLSQRVNVEEVTLFTMPYENLVTYFANQYNIEQQQLDEMIQYSRNGQQQIDQQQVRAMIQHSVDH